MNKTTNGCTDLLNQVSRRRVLQGMMAGIAATAATSGRARAAPLLKAGSSPELLWDFTVPEGYAVWQKPVLSGGSVILVARDERANGGGGSLLSVDVQTHQVRWTNDTPAWLLEPVLLRGILYAISITGDLYAIDVQTGKTLAQTKHAEPAAPTAMALVAGNLVYLTKDGTVVMLDTQGRQIWQYGTGQAGAPVLSTAVQAGDAVLVTIGHFLFALDALDGSLRWRADAGENFIGQLAVDGQNAYITTDDSLKAFNYSTGALSWSWPPKSNGLLSSPTVSGDTIYLCSVTQGVFYALRATDASIAWQVPLAPGLLQKAFIEDGVAYVSSYQNLYAVDLISKLVLRHAQQDAGAYAGVENGVAYVAHNDSRNIAAYDFADEVHQFFCRSQLMAEDYLTSSRREGYQGNTTAYRTQLRFLDEDFNPRVAKSVKVWTSTPAVFTVNNRSYTVKDNASALSLVTDAAGEVSLVVSATDLSCPPLYIWGTFMEVNECVVIYPDFDTQTTLSNVKGSSLQTAKTYDGTLMLPDEYGSADALAATITSTMAGGPGLSVRLKKHRDERRRFADPDRYIAYPHDAPNMLYQSNLGPGTLPYGSPTVPNWETTFSGTEMSYVVTNGLQSAPPLVGLSFDDLLKNVVHGAENVAKVVYNTVDGVVTTIVHTLENVYSFVVNAVEHAVAVVASVLKTVIGDIKKAIQWLSYLFNWGDILKTKDALKDSVVNGVASLKQWAMAQAGSNFRDLHQAFQTFDVNAAFAQGKIGVGNKTIKEQEVDQNNPQDLYDMGGANSYTQSSYLSNKVSENAPDAQIDDSSLGGRLRDTEPFIEAVMEFVADVEALLAHDVRFTSIPKDLLSFFSDFSQLFTDPVKFVTHLLSDVLKLMNDIARSLIALADAIIESFLNMLIKILDSALDVVNKVVHIPVVSQLWEVISRSPLTILDLAALMIAVPTTIISKAIGSFPSRRLGGAITNKDVAYFSACSLQSGFMAGTDLVGPGLSAVLSRVTLGVNWIVAGTAFPTDLATNTTWTYVLYAIKAFPPLFGAFNALPIDAKKFPGAAKVKSKSTQILCAQGVINTGVSVGLAWKGPSAFRGPDWLKMSANVLQAIPFVCRPLAAGEGASPTRTCLSIIDFASFETALGLNMFLAAEG